MSILALDVGTTNLKGILFSEEGKILFKSIIQNEFIKKHQIYELSPLELWKNVKAIIKNASISSKSDCLRSICFSVSSGEVIFPIDKGGNPLSTVFIAYDKRGEQYIEYVKEKIDIHNFYNRTGFLFTNEIAALHRILWFKNYRKDIYNSTWKFVDLNQFIHLKLGFPPDNDFSNMSLTGFFNIKENKISEMVLDAFSIDLKKFGKAVSSGIILGKIKPDVAEKLSLSKDVYLISGGLDQACATLGAGLYKEGEVLINLGTVICISSPITSTNFGNLVNNKFKLSLARYVYNNLLLALIWTYNGGQAIDWYVNNFKEYNKTSLSGENPYRIIFKNISRAKTEVFFLPYFAGSFFPYYNDKIRATVLGLNLLTKIEDITQGFINGLTCDIRQKIEILKTVSLKVTRIVAAGGGAKDREWLQLISNFCNIPLITLENKECGCTGCAIISSLALGIHDSVEEAIKVFITTDHEYQPEKELRIFYDDYYKKYLEIYDDIKDFYK